MANVLNSNELRKGVVFTQGGEAWKVLDYKHIKLGRTPATIKVKVQGLESGTITEKSFAARDTVEEAETSKSSAQYLYQDGNEVYFMDSTNFSQFNLPTNSLEAQIPYMKEGQKIIALFLEGKPVSIELPSTVVLEVVESSDAVAGDSSSNPTKQVKLETGFQIDVPLFVKEGDRLKINTETGEYIGRT